MRMSPARADGPNGGSGAARRRLAVLRSHPLTSEFILIVDDHPVNLGLFKVVLRAAGYTVFGANDAEEALAVLGTRVPALIPMDLQLSGTGGLALTGQLGKHPAYADTVILALTAYAMKGETDKTLAVGCDGYITKPINTREFSAQIASYWRGSAPLLWASRA